jgi:hypothetical protein
MRPIHQTRWAILSLLFFACGAPASGVTEPSPAPAAAAFPSPIPLPSPTAAPVEITPTPFLPLSEAGLPPRRGAGSASPSSPPPASEPPQRPPALLLPDLQTLAPFDPRLVLDPQSGRRFLRLSNSIFNAGPGPLELHGQHDPVSGTTRVVQRIHFTDGSYEEQPVGEFVFHPGHNHWHLDDFAVYEVWSLTSGGGLHSLVAGGAKLSYCLFDFGRYAEGLIEGTAPRWQQYATCGGGRQGLSPGWQDTYRFNQPGQWVDITGLPDGFYALVSRADPDNRLREVIEYNNANLVHFELRSNRLTVLSVSTAR